MPQDIALQTRNPAIDLSADMLSAQRYQAGQQDIAAQGIKNQVDQAAAQDTLGQAGALANYRAAAGKGDPNALGTLKAYPELAAKFHTALESMKPDQQKAAIERGTQIAEAAQRVASLPADSPQRKVAWNAELDQLKKNGVIDQSHYDAYHDNPSDLILDQALSLGQSVKDFTAARSKGGAAGATIPTATLDSLWQKSMDAAGLSAGAADKITDPAERASRLATAKDIYNQGKALIGGGASVTNAVSQAKGDKSPGGPSLADARKSTDRVDPTAPTAPALSVRNPALGAAADATRNVPVLGPALGGLADATAQPATGSDITKTARPDVIPAAPAKPAAAGPPAVDRGNPSLIPRDVGSLAASLTPNAARPSNPALATGKQAPASVKDWKPGMPPPASHANAKQVKSRAELEALPSGTPVILPDGTPTYRK